MWVILERMNVVIFIEYFEEFIGGKSATNSGSLGMIQLVVRASVSLDVKLVKMEEKHLVLQLGFNNVSASQFELKVMLV